eukprot:TRINITY_DN9682_c0_g2_i1.p1 TRINITY_DN9682_c0_g2~~TRINITY_DN9682_c0_g2_i1.p1  ORF type:complete len:393 (+),score=103.98 TRINITY_DN9682_c0_g2_i1:116-1294(+)
MKNTISKKIMKSRDADVRQASEIANEVAVGSQPSTLRLLDCAHEVLAWCALYSRTGELAYFEHAVSIVSIVNSSLSIGDNKRGLKSSSAQDSAEQGNSGQCLNHLVVWMLALNAIMEIVLGDDEEHKLVEATEKATVSLDQMLQQSLDLAVVLGKYFVIKGTNKVAWQLSEDLATVMIEDARQIDIVETYVALLKLEATVKRRVNCEAHVADTKEDLNVLSQVLEAFESSINGDSMISSDYASMGRLMLCVSGLGSILCSERRVVPFKVSLMESMVKSVEKSCKLIASEMMVNPVRSASLANYRSPGKELQLGMGFRGIVLVSEALDRYEFLSAKQVNRMKKSFQAIEEYAGELVDEVMEFWGTSSNQESMSWSCNARMFHLLQMRIYSSCV